jgi:hypothetical protein
MKIILNFENINCFNGAPLVAVSVNDVNYHRGPVTKTIQIECPDTDHAILNIEHYGKQHCDTQVSDGVIVQDKNFTLKNIVVDEYDIEELKWDSNFTTHDNTVIPGCLFFGPNGTYSLSFQRPILKWILQTRHQKNHNDPNWEEDYNYYCQANKLLQEIL